MADENVIKKICKLLSVAEMNEKCLIAPIFLILF